MALEIKDIEKGDSPQFRNFDWEKAKTFYYVAKFGSFSSAAHFLNISQSSLSRQVIFLEHHLGCPLFSRHSGGVRLTRKGEELVAIVETTFINLRGFTLNTYVKNNGNKRKIRIATTRALAAYSLNRHIIEYNKYHSDIIFELIAEDDYLDIAMNDVDITIRPRDLLFNVGLKEDSLQQDYLFSVEKRLYASPKYLEAYGEPQTVEEMKHHHVIAFGHPGLLPYADINWILRLGMPEGELHEPVYISNSLECLVEAAKDGVGIISSYEEMSLIKNANLKNILPDIKAKKLDNYFIYPNYLKKDKDFTDLKNYLQMVFSK